ncbi:MAG: DUF2813 domain-containing protein [Acidobacteria bacterium]|nr:DUF2813 domain-containing protein [Acidobacteriota bacterium]
MYLRSIRIENFRAIREGFVSFDETTLLIGENDSGRTSVIEALALILGAEEERFEARLQPLHIHQAPGVSRALLRIQLSLEEHLPGAWRPPPEIASAFDRNAAGLRCFRFDFEASATAGDGQLAVTWFIRDTPSSPAELVDSPLLLDWLRQMAPMLWLRSGVVSPAQQTRGGVLTDPLLAEVARCYHNLVAGTSADLVSELERGAAAAAGVVEKYTHLFAGAAPLMGAMAAEVLRRTTVAPAASLPSAASAARKIGMVLLLGAVLQLARRATLPEAMPLLVLDNPESNLHPMTLASVWRLLERVSIQKIISTNSGTLLSNAPLSGIRRLTRIGGQVSEWRVQPGALTSEDLRRVAYHVRSRRASALFARCWLLAEGETEFWVMPELARVLGYDFGELGIAPVEFAQAGLRALVKLADALGISWHLMADGDTAGDHYVSAARDASRLAAGRYPGASVTQLPQTDIEHCFWFAGFDDVIRKIAYPKTSPQRVSAKAAIHKAIERTSNPFLALSLIEAAAGRGPASVPAILRQVIEDCVQLANAGTR